jgi:flagellar hook protein FlgE
MPISQALYTGVTGLSANADGMAVIANNIANANAKGFKRDRAEFEDMLSMDLQSGAGAAQIGRGARLRNVRTIHSQGGLAVTDILTDLAIQGQGFFVLSNPNTEVQESAGKFYTRVGAFMFDKNGYLADSAGGRVQGYSVNEKGSLSTRLSDIRIETNSIPPNGTQKLTLDINLDARIKTFEQMGTEKNDPDLAATTFNIADPEATSHFNNTTTIFDSYGAAHQMTVFFERVQAEDGEIQWDWHGAIDGKESLDPPEDGAALVEVVKGSIKFDNNGLLLKEEFDESMEINFAGGAKLGQKIELDFGKSLDEGGKGVGASTAIASKSITNFHAQDGYEAGNIKSLQIDMDGQIRGIYTNGLVRTLGAVAVASFENQDGMMKAGRNQFYATIESGPPKIGMAQSGTRGSIFASSLEESNVDLATEFVNMIVTQRGFQANSRSITTTDTMIEEIVNLKR